MLNNLTVNRKVDDIAMRFEWDRNLDVIVFADEVLIDNFAVTNEGDHNDAELDFYARVEEYVLEVRR